MAKMAFNYPKRMLDLGPDAGLKFFRLLSECAPRRVLLLLALVSAHGYLPVHAHCLWPLGGTFIPGIGKYNFSLAMQQGVSLGHIVEVRCGAKDGVPQVESASMPICAFIAKGH